MLLFAKIHLVIIKLFQGGRIIKKKKGKKRSSKSLNSKSLLKNRKLLFGAAIVLAIVVVAGFASFAGGAKTMGKVYSWKQGKVINNYKTAKTSPGADYQFVMFNGSDWGNEYYGTYTEKTEPAFGSRELLPGDEGQDVLLLNSALKYIGGFQIYTGSRTDITQAYRTVSTLSSTSFASLVNSSKFDDNTSAAIKAISYPNLDSSYGTYLDDNKLDSYELARILTIATSHWGAPVDNSRMVTFTVGGKCKPICAGFIKPDTAKYTKKKTTYYGQTSFRKSGEALMKAYPAVSFAVNKEMLNDDSTKAGKSFVLSSLKGNYAKTVQSMLNLAIKWGHITAFKTDFNTNGVWDAKSQTALKSFEKFYGLTQDGKWDSRIEYHVIQELGWALYE